MLKLLVVVRQTGANSKRGTKPNMPLASLDLRQNKNLLVAITAAISAYLEQKQPVTAPGTPVAAAKSNIPQPGFWRVLKYMFFQR